MSLFLLLFPAWNQGFEVNISVCPWGCGRRWEMVELWPTGYSFDNISIRFLDKHTYTYWSDFSLCVCIHWQGRLPCWRQLLYLEKCENWIILQVNTLGSSLPNGSCTEHFCRVRNYFVRWIICSSLYNRSV